MDHLDIWLSETCSHQHAWALDMCLERDSLACSWPPDPQNSQHRSVQTANHRRRLRWDTLVSWADKTEGQEHRGFGHLAVCGSLLYTQVSRRLQRWLKGRAPREDRSGFQFPFPDSRIWSCYQDNLNFPFLQSPNTTIHCKFKSQLVPTLWMIQESRSCQWHWHHSCDLYEKMPFLRPVGLLEFE